MKENKKKNYHINPIFTFFIGLFLAVGTVYAYSYFADTVGFTSNKGLTSTNVQDAIDEVYADVITLDGIKNKVSCTGIKKYTDIPITPSVHGLDVILSRNNKVTTVYMGVSQLDSSSRYDVQCPFGGACYIQFDISMSSLTAGPATPVGDSITIKDVVLQNNIGVDLRGDITYIANLGGSSYTLKITNITINGELVDGYKSVDISGTSYSGANILYRAGLLQFEFSFVNKTSADSCPDTL